MQLRLLRIALGAGLLAVAACAQDPQTHSTFTAVQRGAAGTSGAAGSSPSDGGAGSSPLGDGATHADGNMTIGCGMTQNQGGGTYVKYDMMISGPDLDANNQPVVRDRVYYVRLPKTYDPTRAYPVVYLGPGCGGQMASEVINLVPYAGEDAILVPLMPTLGENLTCFEETMNSPEYSFFDALHKKIESEYCVDTDRQFYAGFSTGARLGFMVDCAFSDVLRATATIQGGTQPLPTCKTHPIAGMFVADTQETGNPYQQNVTAAERVAAKNGCTGTFQNAKPVVPMATAAAPATTACVQFTGCPADYPVIVCTTMGQGHMTFEPWSDQVFWNFFKAF
jgi:hypothetical protein